MDNYVTGNTIKRLRESKNLTQIELAEYLNVSDKTISKWETGRGLPDITLIESLSQALGVSVIELMSGNEVTNSNKSSNLIRTKFYVCPVCGNIINAVGDSVISCCGITLPACDPITYKIKEGNVDSDNHYVDIQTVEDQFYITLNHEMTKTHYISFIAAVSESTVQVFKQYPEWNPEAKIDPRYVRYLYVYCNKDGLYKFVL